MLKKTAKKAEAASHEFLHELWPEVPWGSILDRFGKDREACQVQDLVETAYQLYFAESEAQVARGLRWNWPFAELREEREAHGKAFQGHEPWTVLLRHAVSLAPDPNGLPPFGEWACYDEQKGTRFYDAGHGGYQYDPLFGSFGHTVHYLAHLVDAGLESLGSHGSAAEAHAAASRHHRQWLAFRERTVEPFAAPSPAPSAGWTPATEMSPPEEAVFQPEHEIARELQDDPATGDKQYLFVYHEREGRVGVLRVHRRSGTSDYRLLSGEDADCCRSRARQLRTVTLRGSEWRELLEKYFACQVPTRQWFHTQVEALLQTLATDETPGSLILERSTWRDLQQVLAASGWLLEANCHLIRR